MRKVQNKEPFPVNVPWFSTYYSAKMVHVTAPIGTYAYCGRPAWNQTSAPKMLLEPGDEIPGDKEWCPVCQPHAWEEVKMP